MEALESDAELITLFIVGNHKAFDSLVSRYYGPLKSLLNKWTKNTEDAEDLAQDTFMQARARISQLREPTKFKSWLFITGMNLMRNQYRDRQRRKMTNIDDVQLIDPSDIDSTICFLQWRDSVMEFGIALPSRQRRAFLMRLIFEYTFQEIADLMECPYDTAKANFRHALMKYKKSLEAKKEGARFSAIPERLLQPGFQ